MDTNDTTNPAPEADEAEAPEVETTETLAAAEPDENAEDGGEAPEEEEEELDLDGLKLRLKKAYAEKVKAGFMKNSDYTQKTQHTAEERKQLAEMRQSLEWESQTKAALFNEEAQLLTLNQRLEQFQNVNWQALAQQDVQQYAALQAEYTQLRDFHERLSGHVEGRRSELSSHREQATATALQKAVEHLSKPKPDLGWDGKFDADKRASLTKFGMDLGFSNEELSNTSHPLMIQTLNLARIGYETLRKQNASLKTSPSEAKPVPQVATGKTRTGPVNPDRLSTEEWVKWRERDLAKKQSTR
jgi:hypothetical protein